MDKEKKEQKTRFLVYFSSAWTNEPKQLKGDFDSLTNACNAILDNHEFAYEDFFDDAYTTDYNEQYYALREEINKWLITDRQVSSRGLTYTIEEVIPNQWRTK